MKELIIKLSLMIWVLIIEIRMMFYFGAKYLPTERDLAYIIKHQFFTNNFFLDNFIIFPGIIFIGFLFCIIIAVLIILPFKIIIDF